LFSTLLHRFHNPSRQPWKGNGSLTENWPTNGRGLAKTNRERDFCRKFYPQVYRGSERSVNDPRMWIVPNIQHRNGHAVIFLLLLA
jgi:hypothetical protein